MRRPWAMSGEYLFKLCNPQLAANQLLARNDNEAGAR
jgi:hypothetical protein